MASVVLPSASSNRRRFQRRSYGEVAADSAIVATATLGTVAAWDASSWPVAEWLLVLAALGMVVRILLRARTLRRISLATQLTARCLLATGCAIALAARVPSTQQELVGALAAALLVGSTAAEPFLRRAARFTPPVAANLPGVPSSAAVTNLSPTVVCSSLFALATGLVLVALGGSSWWWLLVCVLALVAPAWLAARSRSRVVQARRLRALVPQAVAAYAPEFVVYTSRPDDASYQVNMWLPYLQRAGLRFLIITRNGVPARALAELTDVPIVEARRIGDLDALVPPSLKAAFYVNASSGNGAFVRYKHLTHTYLGHGDSDKPPSYNPTHAMYDRIFAAGPAATRRYAAHGVRIPEDKFQIVGRPQVEGVTPANRSIGEVEQPVVLYAPTWRGHVEETMLYSLPAGEDIVSALLAFGATVIFRPHPFSYDFAQDAAVIARIQERLRADAASTGREHLWGPAAESERGILDCINASDAMVSDVSSVVSDYLFSGKPFAMVAVPSEPADFVEEYPVARAAYVIRGDLANLNESLASMLGADPNAGQRTAIRVDYLGGFPAERYADAFVAAVRQVASAPHGGETSELDDDEGGQPDRSETGEAERSENAGGEGEGEGGEGGDAEDSGSGRGGTWSRYRRLLRGVGLTLGSTALALGSLASVLLDAPRAVTVALALLALIAAALSRAGDVRRVARWNRLLSHSVATRAVLLGAAAGCAVTDEGLYWAPLVAAVLLGVALVGESKIRTAWGRVGLEVVGLRAVSSEVAEPLPRGAVPVLSAVTIFAVLVLGAVGAPGWLLALLSALFFVVFVDVLVRALTRAARALRAEGRLHDALLELAPQFAVYFASTVGAAYQVGMWLPYFLRIGRPFIIVTRSVTMMREIAAVTTAAGVEVPIIYRPSLRSLEEVVVPSMRASFYVNNAVRNTHFVERRELVHVWLNHGDSEKPACYNPVHAIYDLLFAAGQAGIDRYARHGIEIPAEKFLIVGRPQVESIEPARGPIVEQDPPTVLYAPTWQGPFADTRVYSLPMGRQIVEQLLVRGARVIFRAHPFNYRFQICVDLINEIGRLLAADREATGRQHVWGAAAEREMTIEECFNASDAMVSDVSAVVSDYLRSDKPFAIVSVGRSPEKLMEEAPAARAGYVIRQDLDNLDQVYRDLLGPDPLADVRRETKIYYLGDFGSEHYADGFLNAARSVIDSGRRS